MKFATGLPVAAICMCITWGSVQAQNNPYLVSPDGQYLGNIGGQYDSNSINNPYGRYGSKYSSESVNNPYGEYGSRYSNKSPSNPYATEQPRLIDPNSGTSKPFGGSPYSR